LGNGRGDGAKQAIVVQGEVDEAGEVEEGQWYATTWRQALAKHV
jgi:hypothetical protein